MLDDLDLNAIQDKNARELIEKLLNMIEQLSAELREVKEENQRLRDEINRLKGEQAKPNIKANKLWMIRRIRRTRKLAKKNPNNYLLILWPPPLCPLKTKPTSRRSSI